MKPKEIVALRERIGLTQGELAKKLGITRDCIAKYEKGRIHPGPEVIDKLMHIVFANPEISKEELETHIRIQQIHNTNQWLIKMYNGLESDERISVFEMVRSMYKKIGTRLDNVIPK